MADWRLATDVLRSVKIALIRTFTPKDVMYTITWRERWRSTVAGWLGYARS